MIDSRLILLFLSQWLVIAACGTWTELTTSQPSVTVLSLSKEWRSRADAVELSSESSGECARVLGLSSCRSCAEKGVKERSCLTTEDKDYTNEDEPAVFGCCSGDFGRRTINSERGSSTEYWRGSRPYGSVKVGWSIKLGGGILSSSEGR